MVLSNANNRQIDGDHYKEKPYQHWDWVIDTKLHYILANATKYLSRWRTKNGLIDLEKSKHYLEKAIENKVTPPDLGLTHKPTMKFIKQLNIVDGAIIMGIMENDLQLCVESIEKLISDELDQCGADRNYTNQDQNKG